MSQHYEIVCTDGTLFAGPFNSLEAAEAFACIIAPIVDWRILPCPQQMTSTGRSIEDRIWHDPK